MSRTKAATLETFNTSLVVILAGPLFSVSRHRLHNLTRHAVARSSSSTKSPAKAGIAPRQRYGGVAASRSASRSELGSRAHIQSGAVMDFLAYATTSLEDSHR